MDYEKLDRARVATDENYRRDKRRRCQTDTLFLAFTLGYTKMIERVHRPAVEKCCVQKNPDKPIEEQSTKKNYLHLDPRGTYKSTLEITDAVQWIICFPNVRICILTATKPLAAAIAGEITDHFVCSLVDEKTDFQLLFPEFCITPKEKRVGEYTAPCRTRDWRESTVMAFSIETSISGWHFDVGMPDDPVDTQNSSTTQGIEKVKKNWRINKKTFMPWAYIMFKGTRYGPFELWGDIIEKATPDKTNILIRSALTLKNGKRLEEGEFPKESEVDLLFPELLSYDFLKAEFEDDYASFMTQYMNDAHGANEVTFPIEILHQAAVSAELMPIAGQTFIAWRFAYGDSQHTRRTGAAVGTLENGRLYIADVVSGSFKPSVLAHEVVTLAKKHGCHEVQIEDTPGARHAEAAIQNYAAVSQWPLQLRWLEFQEDESVRDLRMKSTEPLITAQRLLFNTGMKELPAAFKQFSKYGMMDDSEIVDVVSRVAEALPKSIVPQENEVEQDLAWEMARQREMYDKTHGIGQFAPMPTMEIEAPHQPIDIMAV